jgi:hypothetical protein
MNNTVKKYLVFIIKLKSEQIFAIKTHFKEFPCGQDGKKLDVPDNSFMKGHTQKLHLSLKCHFFMLFLNFSMIGRVLGWIQWCNQEC